MRFKRKRAMVALAATAALVLSACGSDGGDDGGEDGAPKLSNAALGKIYEPSDQKGGTLRFGHAGEWGDTVDPGETYYGSFQSIDSELVLTGLRFGAVPLLVLLATAAACLISLLPGRATPAAVAIAAQVPAFATVALITQYGFLVWFVAGVAVTAHQREEPSEFEDLSTTLDTADSISQPGSASPTPDGAARERV